MDMIKLTEDLLRAVRTSQGVHEHIPVEESYYDHDSDVGVYLTYCGVCNAVYDSLMNEWEPIDV